MLPRRLAICCAVMLATLVFPTHARAGLMDIIWEMSGPQMIGTLVRCRIPFNDARKTCEVKVVLTPDGRIKHENVWLALEGGAYVSTGLNNGGTDYKFGRIGMFAFEPMLEFRYAGDIAAANEKPRKPTQSVAQGTQNTQPESPRWGAVYGGVGLMINRFVVKGSAPSFTKYGVKVRPIAITYGGWTVEYNLRLYPDGFTPDQFGFGPPVSENHPFEAVQSIGVTIPWATWRLWP